VPQEGNALEPCIDTLDCGRGRACCISPDRRRL
jgi:hypothetical protein